MLDRRLRWIANAREVARTCCSCFHRFVLPWLSGWQVDALVRRRFKLWSRFILHHASELGDETSYDDVLFTKLDVESISLTFCGVFGPWH